MNLEKYKQSGFALYSDFANKLGNPKLFECRALGAERNERDARAFAARAQPIIAEIARQGFKSRRSIAEELNRRAIPTARGGRWGAQTVANVLSRIAGTDR